MSDPFNSSDSYNPYDTVPGGDRQLSSAGRGQSPYDVVPGGNSQNAGPPQPQRFITDPGAIIRMVLCCLLLGLAVLLFARAVPNLRIALGGTTATAVVDSVQECSDSGEQATVVFLDPQGHEHFGVTTCDIYLVGDTVTIHYLAADPDGGIFTDGDIPGINLLAAFAGASALAGLILLVLLLLRLKKMGIRRLSPVTLITALILIALVTGTLYVTRPGPPDKTSYRHYHIGEAVNVQGMWSVTIKGVQRMPVEGVTLAPGEHCLTFDVSFRNLTNQQQTPNGGDFSLSTAGENDQFSSYCLLASNVSNVAPGSTQEGQVGLIVPDSFHQFWLAYAPAGGDSRSVWDISVASSTASGISYHPGGETVAARGRL